MSERQVTMPYIPTTCGCICHAGMSLPCACEIDTCYPVLRGLCETRDEGAHTRKDCEGMRPHSHAGMRLAHEHGPTEEGINAPMLGCAACETLPPTCALCSGIGHVEAFHDSVPRSVLTDHAAELRAMADDLRDNLGPIGSPLYIARSARAEAHEECAKRLDRDAQ